MLRPINSNFEALLEVIKRKFPEEAANVLPFDEDDDPNYEITVLIHRLLDRLYRWEN